WTSSPAEGTSPPFSSGAQRLPNGNTLIFSGLNGIVFEVTPAREVVWRYVAPPAVLVLPPQRAGSSFLGQPGEVLGSSRIPLLNMTAEQKKQLDVFQKEVTGKLDRILTPEQRTAVSEARPASGPD